MNILRNINYFAFYKIATTNPTAIFGMKLGLVAGTAYYIAEQGVWRDSQTTINLYNKIKENLSPYTQEIGKQIPYELPSLPKSGEISYLAKYYWNKGVLASFEFLANVPSYIGDYSAKGLESILDNTEVKTIVGVSSDTKK